jgi:pimeloyl-ACP methyl ester carboxylesterase
MSKPIEFLSGGQKIFGRFYPSEGDLQFPTVLLLNGFPGSYGESTLGQKMVKHGINTFAIHYRGTGNSDGQLNPRNVLEDVDSTFKFLRREEIARELRVDTSKMILGGQSFGGGIAFAYSASHPEVKRIFTIAGDDHGEFAREYKRDPEFAARTAAWFKELEAPAGPIRYDSQATIKELLENPEPYDLRKKAGVLADRDILMIAGWDDTTVTIENKTLPFYRSLKAAHAEKVQIVAFQDDHYFRNSLDEIAETVVKWIKSGYF